MYRIVDSRFRGNDDYTDSVLFGEFPPAQELWAAIFNGEGSFDLTSRLTVLACGDGLEGSRLVVLDGNCDGAFAHTGHV
jgi:hypothetical protein